MTKKIVLFFILCCAISSAIAQKPLKHWESYGNPDFSMPCTNYGSIVVSSTGIVYVAVEDGDGVFSVMSMQNGKWSYVGNPRITAYVQAASLAIGPQDAPYIAYTSENNNTHVMTFNGSKWVSVGTNFKGAVLSSKNASLAIDVSGIPYIALYASNGDAIVEAFENDQWIEIGSPFTQLPTEFSLAVNFNGIPYVALTLNSGVVVMTWNSDNWVSVGNTLSVNAFNGFSWLAFSPQGTPYVLYSWADKRDFNKGKVSVFQLNNNNVWSQLGNHFLSIYNSDSSIVISSTGVPYISFSSFLNHDKVAVMSWNKNEHQWIPMGNINISADPTYNYTSLAMDAQNNLYVLYDDDTHKAKATVETLR